MRRVLGLLPFLLGAGGGGAVAAAAVAAAMATSAPAAGAFWCAWAPPNSTLTLGISGVAFVAGVKLTALVGGADGPSATAATADVQLGTSSLHVVVPAELPLAAYRVEVGGASHVCGAPDIWWAQGEAGNASLTGGWIRVFGRNLALPSAARSTAAERRRSVRSQELAAESQRAALKQRQLNEMRYAYINGEDFCILF